MKIIFITNKISNHQVSLCNAFYYSNDIDFSLVETLMNTDAWHVGWNADSERYNYVESAEYVYKNLTAVKKRIDDADVVIFGSAPDSFVANRIKQGKLTFRYSERFYKQGLHFNNFFRAIIGAWLHHGRFQNPKFYMLCASAYTSGDAAIFRNYMNRCFKWGYFPEFRDYPSVESVIAKKDVSMIVWAARQIDWKHPEVVIEVAKRLKADGVQYRICLIGDGEMHSALVKEVEENKLTDCVLFKGSISPIEVRDYMEKAGVFLFTSDFQEGWGAVLNEAMNSGCAVVASHAAGATPYLIDNGINGSIYRSDDVNELYQKVKEYLLNPELQKAHGKMAYDTIRKLWNGETAAKRFIAVCQAILKREDPFLLFEDGPCSKAELIKNNWYHTED